MYGTGDDDEPRTPPMKHIQTLVRESSEFREHVVLARKTNDQGYIGVCQASSVMCLPVDISLGAEKD